ncbi:M48 family metallopeptidase [filamentous cyanobacterium LEGE 11480]|uniref:M48 family metallopeptidase n=1 Tax=Romeriopsis navalis LEGE 11480 TaxID=2777977 RepID=A0A928VM03_9CYAN|nr:M48 family metallopeptidase [Romeriopsis navalis]MBE9031078.1 M48 family metallopeptidase [Romeriopsis navalis LEGE 11480]
MPTITLNQRRIHQLELVARNAPKTYRQKVLAYLVLGYFILGGYVLGTVLLGLICANLGLQLFQFFLPQLPLSLLGLLLSGGSAIALWSSAWMVLRACTRNLYPSPGIRLRRVQAPLLFDLVDRLCDQAGVAQFDHVRLTSEFRVAVCQHPRILGWDPAQNYLLLGVPLLMALSPTQFQALIGRELGHVAQPQTAAWSRHIYGLRQTWLNLLNGLEGRHHVLEYLPRLLLRGYVPQLLTYSFALARIQEYRADQFAAELISRKAIGEALVRSAVCAADWQQLVVDVMQQANHQPQLPPDCFSQILQRLGQGRTVVHERTLLQQLLNGKTDLIHTLPALRDRLMVLGYRREQLQPVSMPVSTAAQTYLGTAWDELREQCDRSWSPDYAVAWQQQYQQFRLINSRLESLASASLTNPLDALRYARKTLEWLGPQEAIPCYQSLLDRDPGNQALHYELGTLLLAQADDRGVAHLEEVIRIDPTRIVEICQDLHRYYLQSGNPAMAEKYVGLVNWHFPAVCAG